MSKGMEVLNGFTTNPGAAFTALTMSTGDSLAVRSFPTTAKASIESLWATGAAGGVIRVRSPRLHDNVQGLRAAYASGQDYGLIPMDAWQNLYPQDVLIAEMTGGGAETDCAALLVYYDDVPGVDARLYDWEQIKARLVNLLGVEVDCTASATIGQYGAALPINTNMELLKANVDYAVLGYEVNVACHTVGLRSVDFGNLRVGGPGTLDRGETRDWFVRNSKRSGLPMIPVFNAANKGATFADVINNAASTAINVTWCLAELASGS